MEERTVYKILKFAAWDKQFISLFVPSSVEKVYKIGEKIVSTTPLFVFLTEQDARDYMGDLPYTVLVEGVTTAKPLALYNTLIMNVDHMDPEKVEEFWKIWHGNEGYVLSGPVCNCMVDCYGVTDFTPTKILHHTCLDYEISQDGTSLE